MLPKIPATGDTILVLFIEPQEPGYTFERKRLEWPLHITLIPWFRVPDPSTLDGILETVAVQSRPFDAVVGMEAAFGGRKEVLVNVLADPALAQHLHLNLKRALDGVGANYQSERFTGDNYKPHITHHGDRRRHEGDRLAVRNFYLVKLLPQNYCQVVKAYELGYNS
ncbi:MAG TPA: 2'-5' RNA ligase family protein [Candidatus Limnocylindrales bacterium]|nr:2'-5' RNA ligase family protein [Candidatus Limnocylindrales bacterium]